MNAVMRLFDSLNKKDVNVPQIDSKIVEKLTAMNSLIDRDSALAKDASTSAARELYTTVVSSLYDYHAAKKDIRVAGNQDQNLAELKQTIRDLKNDLTMAKQEATSYRIQAIQLAGKN
jgi:hypothetical protein